MAGQREELPIGKTKGRVGSRWINARPSSEEIAQWFKDNVPMHEGMDPERYVGGLTLIESTERFTEVFEDDNGNNRSRRVKNIILTPYCKVETRVQYFWDLMEKHPEWAGSIEPVDPPKKGETAGDLPPGFYRLLVKQDSKGFGFVACSMRVRVLTRESANYREQHVISAPPATKMIPVLQESFGKVTPDPFALMKAETGAVGRALGLAGMLVVPGAGVATAEDMLEAQGQGVTPEGDSEAEPPPAVPREVQAPETAPAPDRSAEDVLREEAETKLEVLKARDPQRYKAFQEWSRGRKFKSMADIGEAQLRGIVRKLDKELAESNPDKVDAA